MHAAVRRFHSPDAYDLQGWTPADLTCFGILLQVLIGPRDGEGEESFEFVVCNPEWLRKKYGDDGVIICRHYIIVFDFDFSRIKSAIESLVARAYGEDWHEIALKLSRYAQWEFEDYTPVKNSDQDRG